MDDVRHVPDLVPMTDGVATLRPWTEADVPFLVRAAADPEIPRWTMVRDDLDEVRALAWVRRGHEMALQDLIAPFAIEDRGRAAGSIGLGNFDWRESSGDVFYWLAEEARGRGLATRAVRLICGWGFGELGLARIALYVHPDNSRSHRVAERAGFTREGLLRSAMVVKGERWDVVVFSRLPSDVEDSR